MKSASQICNLKKSVSSNCLIKLDKIDIFNPNLGASDVPVFRNVSLQIHENERWVFRGPTISNKSLLLRALIGQTAIRPSSNLTYPSYDAKCNVNKLIKLVQFEQSTVLNSFTSYVAERYHSYRDTHDLTLKNFLVSDFNENQKYAKLDDIVQTFDLTSLLHKSVINLSNGQRRRAQIARSLLHEPDLILLDEPFNGLDIRSRHKLRRILTQLNINSMVITLRPQDEIPENITNILLVSDCEIQPITSLQIANLIKESKEPDSYTDRLKQTILTGQKNIASSSQVLSNLVDVTCKYRDVTVLQNINWTICRGDRWLLTGPNGSGKTTLLAMITGEHPKAFSNNITLFGRRIGEECSILDLQKNIGHTSPEIHRMFPKTFTGYETISSSWSETFCIPKALDDLQKSSISSILKLLDIEDYSNTRLEEMSLGMQKMFMLARALVKHPDIVILDEPFTAMDTSLIELCQNCIQNYLKSSQAMIYISHNLSEEFLEVINSYIELDENGSIANYIEPPRIDKKTP